MADSDEFPPVSGDDRERRLVQDLQRMYDTHARGVQSLARVRKRLEESRAGDLPRDHAPPQQLDRQGTLRARAGNEQHHGAADVERNTWRQRAGTIAAALFVTLLVGSLIVVLTHAHQSGTGTTNKAGGSAEAFLSIHMIDVETGWAVTEAGHILRTADGGIHWKNVSPTYPASASQQSVVATFLTASVAWAAVSDADATTTFLWRTTDGGQTWQQETLQTGVIAQVTFIDAQDGWLLSKHATSESAETVEIFRTTDGGKTWLKVASALAASTDAPPPGHLPFGGMKTGLGFSNATTGWVAGASPLSGYALLYKTQDGGATWYPQSLTLPTDNSSAQLSLLPPRFFTADDGILPVSTSTGNGLSLDFYVTHDGGNTWQSGTAVTALGTAWDFVNAYQGWASDGTHLSMTADGGQHWTGLSPNATFHGVSRLDFVSGDTGWATGSTAAGAPFLLKTVDGGSTWTVVSYAIL